VSNSCRGGLRCKVYVPVGEPGAAASLMLRNADSKGRSVARIYGVEIRPVSSVEEMEERLRIMTPSQQTYAEWYRLPRMFAVISWGAAATQWLSGAFNDCPGVFCVHSGYAVWRTFGGAAEMDGSRYLQIVGMQGRTSRLAGDVHGISRSDIPAIKEFFGETFRAAELIRDPLPRLQSAFEAFNRFGVGVLKYLDSMVPDVLKHLPTASYVERVFVHAANMLNAIVDEFPSAPCSAWRT
jgi:hypothetical protein